MTQAERALKFMVEQALERAAEGEYVTVSYLSTIAFGYLHSYIQGASVFDMAEAKSVNEALRQGIEIGIQEARKRNA